MVQEFERSVFGYSLYLNPRLARDYLEPVQLIRSRKCVFMNLAAHTSIQLGEKSAKEWICETHLNVLVLPVKNYEKKFKKIHKL
jgi:hypothetical protein